MKPRTSFDELVGLMTWCEDTITHYGERYGGEINISCRKFLKNGSEVWFEILSIGYEYGLIHFKLEDLEKYASLAGDIGDSAPDSYGCDPIQDLRIAMLSVLKTSGYGSVLLNIPKYSNGFYTLKVMFSFRGLQKK